MLRSTDFGGGENKRTPSLDILCCFFLSWLVTWVFIFISTLFLLLEVCSPTEVWFPCFTILLTPLPISPSLCPCPSAKHYSVPFYSILLRKPLTLCETTTIVLRADYNSQITGDIHCPTPSSVQSLQKTIAQRVRAELICCQGFWDRESESGCLNRHRFRRAEGAGLGKGGCETRPCKSDFTDTTSQPDQNQLCAKWLITVSLKYSRSCCLFLGWKKNLMLKYDFQAFVHSIPF